MQLGDTPLDLGSAGGGRGCRGGVAACGAWCAGHREPMPAGAWILTSALRVGLARYVGQVVRDHSLASTSTKARVVAVGITSLGRVLHRQLLDNAQVSVRPGAPWPRGEVGPEGRQGPRPPT